MPLSIHDLTFHHYLDPASVDQFPADTFTTFAETAIPWNGHVVRAAIIGTSHFVIITGPKIKFAELLCCTGSPPPNLKRANIFRGANSNEWWVKAHGRRIETRIWTTSDHGVPETALSSLIDRTTIIDLYHDFPGRNTPTTLVRVTTHDERNEHLTIDTAHEYPQDDNVMTLVARTITTIRPH